MKKSGIIFALAFACVFSSVARANYCDGTPHYEGRDTQEISMEFNRTSDHPMEIDLAAKVEVFDVYSFQKMERVDRWEPCRWDPNRQRMCRVTEERCRTRYRYEKVSDSDYQIVLQYPPHLNLKPGQEEQVKVRLNPLREGNGQALKVDTVSLHHWYKGVRLSRDAVANQTPIVVPMKSIWDK